MEEETNITLTTVGYNARLDTIHATVLLAKLKHVNKLNEYRRIIADQYNKTLKDITSISLSLPQPAVHHVYHQFTIRTLNGKRDKLKEYRKDKDIIIMVYYPIPLHEMVVFGNNRSKILGSLKNAELATQSVLSLPIIPIQGTEEINYIINCLRDFFIKDHEQLPNKLLYAFRIGSENPL